MLVGLLPPARRRCWQAPWSSDVVGILTNAGIDDRLPPDVRRVVEQEDRDHLLQQQQEEAGRRAAARRTRHRFRAVPFEAQQPVSIEVADGETRSFENGVALEFEFEEPEYDESVPSLGPYIIGNRYDECAWWPFKPKGARAGLRPRLGPAAWAAILDQGLYCIRCLWRHQGGAWPAEGCTHCYLTADHRQRALSHIEEVGQLWEQGGPNRAQRRAMQRGVRRTKGGIVLPGMAGV